MKQSDLDYANKCGDRAGEAALHNDWSLVRYFTQHFNCLLDDLSPDDKRAMQSEFDAGYKSWQRPTDRRYP